MHLLQVRPEIAKGISLVTVKDVGRLARVQPEQRPRCRRCWRSLTVEAGDEVVRPSLAHAPRFEHAQSKHNLRGARLNGIAERDLSVAFVTRNGAGEELRLVRCANAEDSGDHS